MGRNIRGTIVSVAVAAGLVLGPVPAGANSMIERVEEPAKKSSSFGVAKRFAADLNRLAKAGDLSNQTALRGLWDRYEGQRATIRVADFAVIPDADPKSPQFAWGYVVIVGEKETCVQVVKVSTGFKSREGFVAFDRPCADVPRVPSGTPTEVVGLLADDLLYAFKTSGFAGNRLDIERKLYADLWRRYKKAGVKIRIAPGTFPGKPNLRTPRWSPKYEAEIQGNSFCLEYKSDDSFANRDLGDKGYFVTGGLCSSVLPSSASSVTAAGQMSVSPGSSGSVVAECAKRMRLLPQRLPVKPPKGYRWKGFPMFSKDNSGIAWTVTYPKNTDLRGLLEEAVSRLGKYNVGPVTQESEDSFAAWGKRGKWTTVVDASRRRAEEGVPEQVRLVFSFSRTGLPFILCRET